MRKRMAIVGVLSALAVSMLPALPAHAAGYLDSPVPPPTDRIVIDLVTVLGSGCPTGTSAVAVAPDNTAFTVTYSQYLAQVGVGAKPTDFRKNCQLSLLVHVPQGFTYAISEADYRGFAALESGAAGTERANYYFQGFPQTTSVSHVFSGPLMNDWQATDVTDVAQLVYLPCGVQRDFNINTQLLVSAGTSDTTTTTSFMTMDSTDYSLATTYHFSWLQCP
jgi:Domain of unknown function (DUF4360)